MEDNYFFLRVGGIIAGIPNLTSKIESELKKSDESFNRVIRMKMFAVP